MDWAARTADRQAFASQCEEDELALIGWQIRETHLGAVEMVTEAMNKSPTMGPLHPPYDVMHRAIMELRQQGLSVTAAEVAATVGVEERIVREIALGAPAILSVQELELHIGQRVKALAARHGRQQLRSRLTEAMAALDAGDPNAMDIVQQAEHSFRASRQAGRSIMASPFTWTDPEKIPPRCFLFVSRHAVAGHVSLTGAFGGTGKSSFEIAECLAHRTGRNLLNDAPLSRGNAWYLGFEDSVQEHTRRVVATALLHKIDPAELQSGFYLNDANQDFVVAREGKDGVVVAEPVVEGIISEIKAKEITFLVVDPFVASHGVSENNNGAIDVVARLWVRIARETGCAVELVHHLRKGNGNDPSADDFRGASALLPAVRAARLLSTMSKDEGDRLGVAEPLRHFRVIDAKRNMAARSSQDRWHQLTAIDLRNGNPSDHVAAVESWRPPDASSLASVTELEAIKALISEGDWRADFRSKTWVGNAIAQVLDLDLRDMAVRKSVADAIKAWLGDGTLIARERKDPNKRKDFTYVEVAS